MGRSISSKIKALWNLALSKQGSITLFVAVLLSACIFLQSTFSYLLGKQVFEHLILKNAHAYTEYALSRYHYPLKERFALLGMVDLADTEHFYAQMKNFEAPRFYPRPDVKFHQDLIYPMSESKDLLWNQIKYVSTLRLGAKALSLMKEAQQQMQAQIKAIEGGKSDLESAKQSVDELESLEDSLIQEEEEKDEERSFFENILLEALNFIKSQTASALSMEDGSISGDLSSFLMKSMDFFSDLEKHYYQFQMQEKLLLDKFLVLSYALNIFSFQTSQLGSESLEKAYQKLLSGHDRKDFPSKEIHQVETIVTGLKGKEAYSRVKLYLFILRFLVQFIAIYQSEAYQKHLSFAELISTAIFFLSFGQIYIPPTSIAMVFVAIEALFLAKKDVDALVKGEALAFVPKKVELKVSYSQYLLFFGFLVSKEALIKRIAENIQEEMGEEYALGVRTEVLYEQFGKTHQYVVQEMYFEQEATP